MTYYLVKQSAIVFNIVKLLVKPLAKAAGKEELPFADLTSESSASSAELKNAGGGGDDASQYEWKRLVGSIRRRVQRHATAADGATTPTTPTQPAQPPPLAAGTTASRKNSLTQAARFDFFRRSREEKSRECVQPPPPLGSSSVVHDDDGGGGSTNKSHKPVGKQKSCEPSKGERDDDKKKSKATKATSSSNKTTIFGNAAGNFNTQKHREDFLQATMRIFLVVSPPVGKMQVKILIKNF